MTRSDIHSMKVPVCGVITAARLARVCGCNTTEIKGWVRDHGLKPVEGRGKLLLNLLEVCDWGHRNTSVLMRDIGKRGMLRLGLFISRYGVEASKA